MLSSADTLCCNLGLEASDLNSESRLRNPLREICTVGSVREEPSRWCHGGPKRARSWKRRILPRNTYSLSGLLYSERGDVTPTTKGDFVDETFLVLNAKLVATCRRGN